MEEDDIYSLDLVGMRVIVEVMVGPSEDTVLQPNSENQNSTSSGEHMWIPFAEDIAPDIDMESREMWITPPKGLLDLNSRSDKRSEKERPVMEWKEKKLQRRIIAAKKVLSEMDQGHVLRDLLSGDKVQKASLAEQIGCIDFQLFRHALRSVIKQIDRKKLMKIPYETLMNHGEKEKHVFSNELNKGLEILQKSKAATVLVTKGSDSDFVDAEFQRLLNSSRELMKAEENRLSPRFIIVSPAGHVDSVRNCLVENDYFDLDTQKVWVPKEMELPIVSISSELNGKKILLKSSWEILQKPVGPWAIFSLLPSNKILDTLNEMGVEFVQECNLSNRPIIGHSLFFGAISSRGVDVGITLCKTSSKTEPKMISILFFP